MAVDVDSFLVLLAAAERRLVPNYDFSSFAEPLRSELRYVIQQRRDEDRHALDYRRVARAAEFAAGLGVSSLLDYDQDWWQDRLPTLERRDGGCQAVAFLRYGRLALARLRDRANGVDPYTEMWVDRGARDSRVRVPAFQDDLVRGYRAGMVS